VTALDDWNRMSEEEAISPVLACCGSRSFAARLAQHRPLADVDSLLSAADAIWWSLGESDWLEAFACHPRIGQPPSNASHQFSRWSMDEQAKARSAGAAAAQSIAAKNLEYEQRHGFIYIVCASGRSAEELLAILERRLNNSTEEELREAAENQRQITHLRIRKWLSQ
jgi:OHCU decarboxylase